GQRSCFIRCLASDGRCQSKSPDENEIIGRGGSGRLIFMEMQVTDANPTLIKRTLTEGGIAVLTFNDPDRRNALSPALREQLLQVLRDEAQSTESRAVVLTGEGSAFCAGGDISAMGIDPELSSERMKILHDIARQLALFPKPMVAAVNGHAFGAGWSMSLLCDYVVTAPTA